MTDLIKKVKHKLDEYGIEIYSHYSGNDKEYVFMTEDMMIFITEDESEKSIQLSFQATTRPDVASLNTLIINEVKEDFKINIMDSFVFGKDKTFLSGEEAFKLVEKSIKRKGINEYIKNQTLTDILKNTECFSC
jgi:hypothetical protein